MTNKYLAIYLIDHLAGSVAAIELLKDLEAAYADTALAGFFAELQTDIAADSMTASAPHGSAANCREPTAKGGAHG